MAEDTPAAVPQVNRWIVSFSVVFATFMEVLDTTVVNVSLPHIGGSMSATVEEATWTLTSYLVANAIILPMTGWLANYFGRKRLLMLAVTGFTISSFLCGLAPNLTCLIIFRVMQGLSGGVMQPLSQAIMLEAFPPAERGKAMALFGLCIVTAPILGPVVGGWLTDSYSWRWVFYINIPVGIISLIMAKLYVFDPPYIRRRSSRVDYWGIGMLALGMACLQILLDKGEQEDWFTSHTMTTLAVIAAVALSVFVVVRADRGPSRSQSEGVPGPDIRHRRVPDDHARLCALRQPRAAAHHAPDPSDVSVAAGRNCHGPARHRVAPVHACRRPDDRARRSPQSCWCSGLPLPDLR